MIRVLPVAMLLVSLAASAAAEPLTVAIDHSARLNVQGAAASVVIGNPQVADVTVVDSHTVFVSGRGYGETDVVVLDGAGRTLYAGEIMVGTPGGGRVSIYRGAERTDMACAPACEVSFRSPTKGGGSGSAGGASAPGGGGSSAPSMASMLAGAAGGVTAGATSAARAAGSAMSEQ
jgi:hypothetical protein